MDEGAPAGHQASDRRERPGEVLVVDPDPRLLRHSLERVRRTLHEVEIETRLKVERLVGQLLARASELPGPRESIIQIRIVVTPTLIRLEAEGPATVLPYYADADPVPPGRLPTWMIDDLADRWGPERRDNGAEAAWFLIRRQH